MNTTRYTTSVNDTGINIVVLRSEEKSTAQAQIKLIRAWVKSIGGKSKLVSFTEHPRYMSNLDLVYSARIAYKFA